MTITSIDFLNFKAFGNYSVVLDRMNILVGPNNCGKSTVIGALRALAAAVRTAGARIPQEFDTSDGPCWGYHIPENVLPISIENVHTEYDDTDTTVVFGLSNGNRLKLYFPESGGCLLIPETDGSLPRTTRDFKRDFPVKIGVVPVLGPLEHDEALVDEKTVNKNLATHRASRNFRSYWYRETEGWFKNTHGFTRFSKLVSETWPGMGIQRPELTAPPDPKLRMFCLEDRITRELYWAGFGFQVWCQLLTHIVRCADDAVLVIDEAEVYLHPDMQRKLVAVLRSAGPDIVLATHSTDLIGEAEPSEVILVDKTKSCAQRLADVVGIQTALDSVGSVHNVVLTQLARTRRILFVEGSSDFKILRSFARALGYGELSMGNDITLFECSGFESWQWIRALAWGMEKTLGSRFRIGVVLDRDFHCAEEIGEVERNLKQHADFVHIHKRKEIENYLLVPEALERALRKALEDRARRHRGAQADVVSMGTILMDLTNQQNIHVSSRVAADRSRFFGSSKKDASTTNEEALAWVKDKWETLDGRLELVPGEQVLRELRRRIQRDYGVTLTNSLIIASFRRDEIAEDMRNLLQELERFRTEANTALVAQTAA